jgi:hypothetical protein
MTVEQPDPFLPFRTWSPLGFLRSNADASNDSTTVVLMEQLVHLRRRSVVEKPQAKMI